MCFIKNSHFSFDFHKLISRLNLEVGIANTIDTNEKVVVITKVKKSINLVIEHHLHVNFIELSIKTNI